MLDHKRLQLVIVTSVAAALLFVSEGPFSRVFPQLFGGVGNYLERTSEYFPGQSARTELLHASTSAKRPGGSMATITVSTSGELQTALSSAHAGDTILLAAGTYSAVNLQNLNFTTPVTITSADPTHPATLTDLMVKCSSGLSFSHLEFDASSSTGDYSFQISGSSHIDLSNLWVHGSLDANPQNDLQPMIIRNSSYVTVSSSEFEQAYNALNQLDNDHLTIQGNSFHDIRCDAIRGGGSSYVTVSGNTFTDFYNETGDHSDAIQFWTTNTALSAHDIVITDNVITRGSGSAVQGIFFRDQVGTLPFINVTISNNMLVGTLWNGIDVQHGTTVTIDNNTVAGLPDQKSWIRLDNVVGGSVTNSSAGTLMQDGVTNLNSTAGVSVTGFQVLLPTVDQADQLLQQWFSTHTATSSIYHDELMWMSAGDTTQTTITTTTTSSTTSATDTSTSNTGSTSITDTGTGSTSTTDTGTGTTTGGTKTTGGGSTKGHPVMHKLTASSESPITTTAQTSLSTSTSSSSISDSTDSRLVDLASHHGATIWGPHASELFEFTMQHGAISAAHVGPALLDVHANILHEPMQLDQWVHDFFHVQDQALI